MYARLFRRNGMTKEDAETVDTLRTVETSFEVLDELHHRDLTGVTELASALGRSKSAIHRHLVTLVENGRAVRVGDKYRLATVTRRDVAEVFEVIEVLKETDGATSETVAQNIGKPEEIVAVYLDELEANGYVVKRDGTYQNGLKFLDIGERVKYGIEIFDIAAEEVDKIAAESGEIGLFSVLEHGQNVLMYKASGAEAIHTAHETGLREPLHCSALGKAILSELPEEQVHEILDERGLEAFTEATITDRDELMQDLRATRERGYSIDDGEAKSGLRCVAAPITSENINLYGAVSVTAPKSRMQRQRFEEEMPELVKRAANVVEVNSIYVK